jgi:hypothetical protein
MSRNDTASGIHKTAPQKYQTSVGPAYGVNNLIYLKKAGYLEPFKVDKHFQERLAIYNQIVSIRDIHHDITFKL